MYATPLQPTDTQSTTLTQLDRDVQLRKSLTAVYARRSTALREIARTRLRSGADAWDALQDAFLHVLEHPPADLSERALTLALDTAVRAACGRQERQRSDDEKLCIALRKRFPV